MNITINSDLSNWSRLKPNEGCTDITIDLPAEVGIDDRGYIIAFPSIAISYFSIPLTGCLTEEEANAAGQMVYQNLYKYIKEMFDTARIVLSDLPKQEIQIGTQHLSISANGTQRLVKRRGLLLRN